MGGHDTLNVLASDWRKASIQTSCWLLGNAHFADCANGATTKALLADETIYILNHHCVAAATITPANVKTQAGQNGKNT